METSKKYDMNVESALDKLRRQYMGNPETPISKDILYDLYDEKDKKALYTDHINSESWRRFRANIFRKRGFKCELCSSKKNLHLHHLTYENFGNEDELDVMILCKSCHEKAHNEP